MKYKVGDYIGWDEIIAEIISIDEDRYHYNVLHPDFYKWSYFIDGIDQDGFVRLISQEKGKKIKLELL